MTKDEAPTSPKDAALTLALEALENGMKFVWTDPEREAGFVAIDAIREALAQPEQDDRRLQIAMRQWEDWKAYALELQKKLVKYEGGSPMILNTQPEQYTDIVSDGGLDPRNKFDAQPEQEPVGFAVMERPWVGLTDEDIENCMCMSIQKTCRAIEAKLKAVNGFHSTEKNT